MNEREIRELVETLRRRGLSRPAAFGHHSGVNDEAADVIEGLLAKLHDGRTYTVTEVCPHCENEIEMRWDTDTLGFKAFCPFCGERLMLCDECQHSGPDGGPIGPCDYDSATDTCRFNLPAKKVRRKLVPGSVITSLDELLAQKFIWWMGRPYHNGWFGSWQLRWAATRIREGQIRRVIVIEEEEA